MNTAAIRRRFRWYRAWWTLVGAALATLSWSASPQLLWIRSRPWWAAICLAGALVVTVTAAVADEQLFKLSTSTCTTFFLFRAAAILWAPEFTWRSRLTGAVLSTLVAYACMLLGLVTLALLPLVEEHEP